jgi:hypothetical protein
VQLEKHSTEGVTSSEEAPGVDPWVEVEVLVVLAADLEVARQSLTADWGRANPQR